VFEALKSSWYEDRGTIDAIPGGLRFTGERGQIEMAGVNAVGLVGPIIHWISVLGILAGDVLVIVLAAVGHFNFMTLDNPVTYVVLVLFNVYCVLVIPMTWVRVDYRDSKGQPARAYFTFGTAVGRLFTGPKQLCATLQSLANVTT
jgi:hypothetical protein